MQLGCADSYNTDNVAIISGNNYQIKVRDFWKSYDVAFYQNNKLVKTFKEDIGSEFSYQVDFFAETIIKADWQRVNRHELAFLTKIIAFYPTSK